MSSTNVHSNNNPYLVGGNTEFTENEKEPVNMNQYNEKGEPLSGKGPSRLKVIEGPNTEIKVYNNITARDEERNNKAEARAICKEGKYNKNMQITDITMVLWGRISAIEKATKEGKVRLSKNQEKDIEDNQAR